MKGEAGSSRSSDSMYTTDWERRTEFREMQLNVISARLEGEFEADRQQGVSATEV